MHGIESARYATEDTSNGAPVIAVCRGVQQYRRADDDIEFGGMLAYLAGGGVIAPYVPPTATEADYSAAIQSHVDATAKARGYADGVALAGYSTSTIPAWAVEAASFIAWRDAVWIYAYTELAKVQGGQRPQPSVAGFIAELPKIIWPGG